MIQVLHRAAQVLRCLSPDRESPALLSDIAHQTGLSPATCARILSSLVQEGYAEQIGRRQGYILGPAPFLLTRGQPYRQDLIQVCEPLLHELGRRLHESIALNVLQGTQRVLICRVQCDRDVQVRTDVGRAVNPYAGIAGRVLLAWLGSEELERFVTRAGLPDASDWPGIDSLQTLRRELASYRQDLVVVDDFMSRQFSVVSGPVLGDGRALATIGLYLPMQRFAGEHREEVIAGVRQTLTAMSAALAAARAKGNQD